VGVQDVDLQLFLGGVFTDVPIFATPVTIVRGHEPYGAWPRASTFTCEINDDTLAYDPSRPASILYGIAGRNTAARIRPAGSTAIWGEATSWVPERTTDHQPGTQRGRSGVTLTAKGLSHRIGQWRDSLGSAFRRAVLLSGKDIAEFWPMEDKAGSSTAVSAVAGPDMVPVSTVRFTLPDGSDLPPGGAPRFADGNGVPGLEALPSFAGGGTLRAAIRSRTFDGYCVDFVARCPPGAPADACELLTWSESGTYVTFTVEFSAGFVNVFHSNAADAALLTNTGRAHAVFDPYDGIPHFYRFKVRQSGGDYLGVLYIDGTSRASSDNFVPGMAGTVGVPTEIEWNHLEAEGDEMPIEAGGLVVWASGQASAQPDFLEWAMNGHRGERSNARWVRLNTELGLGFANTGGGEYMGPQPAAPLLAHLKEIRDTDGGTIDDERFSITQYFRTRDSLNALASVLDLTYPGDVAPPFRKTIDDAGSANVVTVENWNGKQVTVTRETGPMSVLAPPLGIGEYPKKVDVNVDRDDRLVDIANWHLAKGTLPDAQYREVTVDLVANPGLTAAVIAVREGDHITVTGADPETVHLHVTGIVQTITSGTRTVTFQTEPYDVFMIGTWDDPGPAPWRWDTGTTTLQVARTTTQTAWTFTCTSINDILSTAVSYGLMVAGELVTLTVMSAASGTGPYVQTGTVTRSVNGVVKAQLAGAEIHLADARRWGL
jgi:hypothetical protein